MAATVIEIRGNHTPLKEKITPFHVNVGSRGRVLQGAKLLEDVKILESSRTVVALGFAKHETAEGKDFWTPLAIYNAGMGHGDVDIKARDVISFSSLDQVFKFQGRKVFTGGKMIEHRAGTAGGVNTFRFDDPVLKTYDIVAGNRSMGTSGAIMQAMGYMPTIPTTWKQMRAYYRKMQSLKTDWEALGGKISEGGETGGFFLMDSSRAVSKMIMLASHKLGYTCYEGTIFSKESLYAEADEKFFANLRRTDNVLSSEMEQLPISYVAAYMKMKYKIDVLTSVATGQVGVVPGTGFGKTREDREKIEKKVGDMVMKVSLLTIGLVAEWMEKGFEPK